MDQTKIIEAVSDIFNADTPDNGLRILLLREDLNIEEKIEVLRLLIFNIIKLIKNENIYNIKKSGIKTFKPGYIDPLF